MPTSKQVGYLESHVSDAVHVLVVAKYRILGTEHPAKHWEVRDSGILPESRAASGTDGQTSVKLARCEESAGSSALFFASFCLLRFRLLAAAGEDAGSKETGHA